MPAATRRACCLLNDVRVGVQVWREAHDLVPGDTITVRWELDVGVVAGSDGSMDFKGRTVHNGAFRIAGRSKTYFRSRS